jgi:hypothetical protein
MGEVIKSYKGFNKNMTCRGFQYEEGKEYEEEIVEVCDHGFHAFEYPLDCLNYYYPNESVYHEVEQSGEIQKHNDDTKVASTKIKIGAEISIAGLVKAAIEYTVKRVKKDAESDEKHGASSATGDYGASSETGDYGASSATGDYGASSATGYCGASSATGYCGASSATGTCGASSETGDYGASSATGTCGASSATGYCGASSAEDKDAVAVAWGYKSKAKGVLGAFLVFADWEYTGSEDDTEYDRNNQSAWVLNGAKMVQVDGENIKPNTWYTIENGEIAEVSE